MHCWATVGRITTWHTTAHGLNRVFQRGLVLDDMKAVVNSPDRKQQQRKGRHGGFVYLFEKEVDSKTLSVVAEIKKSEAWLISGWLA